MPIALSILNIWADGYERVAHIRIVNSTKEFFVSFIEYEEYIETGKSAKRSIGDKIKGNLKIELVMDFKGSNKELSYYQNIPNSPHIKAVVDVISVIDSFSMSAYLYDYNTPVIIEFERQIPKQLKGKIELSGELRVDIVDS